MFLSILSNDRSCPAGQKLCSRLALKLSHFQVKDRGPQVIFCLYQSEVRKVISLPYTR